MLVVFYITKTDKLFCFRHGLDTFGANVQFAAANSLNLQINILPF